MDDERRVLAQYWLLKAKRKVLGSESAHIHTNSRAKKIIGNEVTKLVTNPLLMTFLT